MYIKKVILIDKLWLSSKNVPIWNHKIMSRVWNDVHFYLEQIYKITGSSFDS